MSVKLFSTDIDGTLLNERGQIPEKNKEAILRLEEEGIKVALCSGRPLSDMERFSKELQLAKYGGYLIGANGNALRKEATKETFFDHQLQPELLGRMYALSKKYAWEMTAEGNTESYVFVRAFMKVLITVYEHIFQRRSYWYAALSMKKLEKLEEIPQDINKLIVFNPGKTLARLRKRIETEFQGEIACCKVSRASMEIFSGKCDKVNGLRKVCELEGISLKEVLFIGDGENDVRAVEEAGIGIAVENAAETVKKNADALVSSNQRCGVAEAINKYAFKEEK